MKVVRDMLRRLRPPPSQREVNAVNNYRSSIRRASNALPGDATLRQLLAEVDRIVGPNDERRG